MHFRGYHGTNSARARDILSKNFNASVRAGLWLGDGIYFYQDGLQHAHEWANFISEKRHDTPAVIEARISSRRIIDLTDALYWQSIREIYESSRDTAFDVSQLGMRFLFSEPSEYDSRLLGRNYVDHRLMNLFIKYSILKARQSGIEAPQVVRAAFVEGRPVHPESWLFDKSSVILSVFDPAAISDTTLVF